MSGLPPVLGNLESRYEIVRDRILKALEGSARKNPVTLVAVSKGQSVGAIEALYGLGHRDFGENYVQEWLVKSRELNQRGCSGIQWHFIGHLQTNKVAILLRGCESSFWIHSVDSVKLGLEISNRWRMSRDENEKARVFIQVNVDGEPSKSGCRPEETLEIVKFISVLPGIDLQGLMCIPSPKTALEGSRRAMARLRGLEEACQPYSAGKLSMGMSHDFEVAIQEGATHIRVGTAIFGERSQPM